jgi:hypothetical protein
MIGTAFLVAASGMPLPDLFRVFGGLLVATTAGLLVAPWHWHRRFAEHVVPRALMFLPVIGAVSVALGGLILIAAVTAFRT